MHTGRLLELEDTNCGVPLLYTLASNGVTGLFIYRHITFARIRQRFTPDSPHTHLNLTSTDTVIAIDEACTRLVGHIALFESSTRLSEEASKATVKLHQVAVTVTPRTTQTLAQWSSSPTQCLVSVYSYSYRWEEYLEYKCLSNRFWGCRCTAYGHECVGSIGSVLR